MNQEIQQILYEAIKDGREEEVEFLLDSGEVDPTADSNCALLEAIRSGHDRMISTVAGAAGVKDCFEQNPDPVLNTAVKSGNEIWVFKAMEAGAQPSVAHLVISIKNGHNTILRLMLEKTDMPHEANNAAYHQAVACGNHDAAVILMAIPAVRMKESELSR